MKRERERERERERVREREKKRDCELSCVVLRVDRAISMYVTFDACFYKINP